ncbi:MAG: ATP-binding cassette domain-containing protein [Clostridiales bacterium]|nr:ATP-binding cassette domain-containing protein [Clostridiales bacterium]
MPLLSVDNISMDFHGRDLLDKVSFRINEGDKIAFIGNNGAGKSTLFRIIRGTLTPKEGRIIRHGNTIVGFLSQNMEEQDFNGKTLKPVRLSEKESEKSYLEMELSTIDPGSEAYREKSEEYSKVLYEYEAMGGYDFDFRMKEALAGLGLTDISEDRDLTTLSGGEKMRVCLAQLIVARPDILMLDEPTNHLDIEAVEWLEGFLSSYGGAVFVISHDRHFIDKVANRVIELNDGSVREYKGNYSDYKYQKAEFLKSQEATVKNLEAELEHQLDVKQTMLSHRNISGYHQREKMVNKLQDILDSERRKLGNDPMKMSFTLVPEDRTGAEDKILIQVKDVSKKFDDDPMLFENISFELKANQKLFLCGPNGCGKSTLLTMLLGRQGGFDGTVFVSSGASSGFMGQFVPFENEDITCLEELLGRTDMSETAARNMLARFGFRGLDVFKKICVLSGGERSRLYLCCLLQEKPDILFLDEPTNHLDIESREVLEDALRDYNGAIICVSHDRFFIDKCADSILGFAGGTAKLYDKYKYYRQSLKDSREEQVKVKKEQEEKTSRVTEAKVSSMNRAQERKAEAKRKERLRSLEKEISELEQIQTDMEASFGADTKPEEYERFADNARHLEELYDEYMSLED